MKSVYFVTAMIAVLLLGASVSYAASDPLQGTWAISTSGQAALDVPSSGACKVAGTVPAGLYDATVQFANGQVRITNLGVNIGATNCTSVNFQGTGTYTVSETGDGGFAAKGTFSSIFVGRGAACAATALNNVSFTVTGKIGDKTLAIYIEGLDSGNYAEGPPPGPLTCQAPILNFVASGSGKQL
jgi:hypothetical protein